MPNEPSDVENTDLSNTNGSQVAGPSLEGVTALIQNGRNIAGTSLAALPRKSPTRAPVGPGHRPQRAKHRDPVDGATNSLGTLGCRGIAAAAGAR